MTRLATLNLPSSTGGAKAELLPVRLRARHAVRVLEAEGISVCGVQESATPTRLAWRMRRRWRVAAGRPNNRGLRYLGNVGNDLAWVREIWQKVGPKQHVLLEWPNHHDLHIPKVPLRHRLSGVEWTFYVVHLPAGDAHAETRKRMIAILAADARNHERVVFLGDFNDTRVPQLLPRPWRVYGQRIDWIATKGLPHGWAEVQHERVRGVVSDHPLVYLDVAARPA